LSYKGVAVQEYQSRLYPSTDSIAIANTFYAECCSRIYSPYNYHGITGIEKKYDQELSGYKGGKIVMIDRKTGKSIKTILEKHPKNGRDITLD
jgi:cell division protein FtsI/penicillin-binding protein 2